MIPYVFTILAATILTYFAQVARKNSKIIAGIISAFAILILVFIAGVRDYNIGTDFLFYCYGHFKNAVLSDDYFEYIFHKCDGEWLYGLIVYATSAFSNDAHSVMFTLNLVTISLIYAACWRKNDVVPMTIMFALIMIYFYIPTLQYIRQSLSLGGILLAATYYKGRWGGTPFWIWSILSIGMHRSAIIVMAFIIFTHKLSEGSDKQRLKRIILICIGMAITYFAFKAIITILCESIPFFEKYLLYVSKEGNRIFHGEFNKTQFLYSIICIVFALSSKHMEWLNAKETFIFEVYVAGIVFSIFMGAILFPLARLGIAFYPFSFYYIIKGLLYSPRISLPTRIVAISALFIYWSYFMLRSYSTNDLLIYSSEIIGI